MNKTYDNVHIAYKIEELFSQWLHPLHGKITLDLVNDFIHHT